jgi:hypothetical protein
MANIAIYKLYTPDYLTALNDTCAETSLDILGGWYLSIGLPDGNSPVKVPNHLASYSESMGLNTSGVSYFSVVNPYALYNQMVGAGYTSFTMTPGALTVGGQIQVNVEDPLVTHGHIPPRPTPP